MTELFSKGPNYFLKDRIVCRTHASTLLDVLEERDWAIRLAVLKMMGALQACPGCLDGKDF